MTPLHPAASHGAIELVRLPVERGADLIVRDIQFAGTPLAWARHFAREELIDSLQGLGQ